MNYKGIIFDFNGVLLLDTPLHKRAMFTVSQKMFSKAFSDKEWEQHILGRDNEQIVRFLKPDATEDEIKTFAQEKEAEYRNSCLENPDIFKLAAGAIELLDYLKSQRTSITIATSSPKDNVDFYIKYLHLDRWFDVSKIIYHDGTFVSKPAPDIYLKACTVLELKPSECVVVEDSPSGIESAKKAGIGKIIAVAPYEKHEALKRLGASHVVEELYEINVR